MTPSEIPRKVQRDHKMREMKFKPYLLGTASEAERNLIDRTILTSDGEYEELLSAEDDLIEAFLQDELTATERVQFEQYFLADPDHQQRLRFITSLHRYANDPTKSSKKLVNHDSHDAIHYSWWSLLPRPVWQLAMASILLLGAVVGARFLMNSSSLPLIASKDASPSAEIVTTGTDTFTIELRPGQPRNINSRLPSITITPNIGTVQLILVLSQKSHLEYEAKLLPDAGAVTERKLMGQFKAETINGANVVLVKVPVSVLVLGDQRIQLTGVTANEPESIETYSFTVNQKNEKE